MNRAFKQFAIQTGGTPQPLVGTWVTATTAPTYDVGSNSLTSIPVNDSSMFQVGDWAYFVDASLTASKKERVRVQSIPDGTHIKVAGLTQTRTGGAFGTGDFVALAIDVNSVFVQQIQGNTGNLFLGTEGMNKTGLVKCIALLVQFAAGTQPVNFSDTRYYSSDASKSDDLWIDGTTNDGYLPSFGVA